MSSLEGLLNAISQAPLWWGLALLFAGALIEYIFPPFPGDTVVLFGAFLIGTGTYPFFPTFCSITLGSLVGMTAVYAIGLFLQPRYAHLREGRSRLFSAKALEKVELGFVRYGDWLILANRFLPAIRAVFFLAAGLLRRPGARVISLGAISLLVWNSLIMYAGYQVGNHWPRLQRILSVYNRFILGFLAVLAIVWIVRRMSARRLPKQD